MVAILEAGYGHEPRNVTTKVQNMKIFMLKNEDFQKFKNGKISPQTVKFEGVCFENTLWSSSRDS